MNKKQEKGSVLIVSLMAFAVLSIIAQAFVSATLNEYKLTENTLSKTQAFYLAEGGKNAALAELRERTITQIDTRVRGVSDIARLQSYLPISRSLEFLRDYAYESNNDVRFTLDNPGWGDRAYLVIDRPDAGTGSYSALLEVFTNGAPSSPQSEVFVFPYRYRISATGSSSLRGIQQFVEAAGNFTITVRRDNFARYALFTNIHTSPWGGIVWFTDRTNFTGPVHSNDRFSFALNPSGSFAEGVSQIQNTARFYNLGRPLLLDADRNADRDVPAFQSGFSRGVGTIPLPSTTDRESHQRTALGLPGNQQIPNLPNGIYVPESNGTLSGGIYVQGNADVALGLDVNNHQRYIIRQGATTNEILVDPATNQTTVTTGGSPQTFSGTPNGLLYVNGAVQTLSGTVSNETQSTVASTNDLLITNHVRYQNYSATPTLNATGQNNLLGLLSWTGNVRIAPSAPNNLDVHGTVMAPNGVFTVDNYNRGSPRGTVNLLGGVITNQYGAFGTFSSRGPISGYGRNFVYDGRMLQGYSPPYFPTITLFAVFNNGVRNLPAWDRKRGLGPP